MSPIMEIYRIHNETSMFFITCSVVFWLPMFVSKGACSLLTGILAILLCAVLRNEV